MIARSLGMCASGAPSGPGASVCRLFEAPRPGPAPPRPPGSGVWGARVQILKITEKRNKSETSELCVLCVCERCDLCCV